MSALAPRNGPLGWWPCWANVGKSAAGEQPLSPDVARLLAANDRSGAPHEALSPREFEIFLLLAKGETVDAIAAARWLSVKTVANYQTAIRQKTGLGSALEMYRYAEAHALLPFADE